MKSKSRWTNGPAGVGCFCAALFLTCASTCWAAATNRYVSLTGTNNPPYTNWADAATQIQWAVNASFAGDTVWVTNGAYFVTNEITVSTAITLSGVNGASNTIVNGNYPTTSNRCFNITLAGAVVDGFTITNGTFTNWGGSAYVGGGGVNMTAGLLKNCIVTGNRALTNGFGGGIRMTGGTLQNCVIAGNSCVGSTNNYGGGGVGISGSGAVVTNCVIYNNTASVVGAPYGAGGGGVFVYSGNGKVRNCTIYSNVCNGGQGGGGVNLFQSANGELTDSVIYGNIGGGGIYNYCGLATGPLIRNCLIYNNSGGARSGIAVYYAINIQNCTIVSNTGAVGLYFQGEGTFPTRMANTISYFNAAGNWSFTGSSVTNISLTNTCTTPTNFTAGVMSSGSISNAPQFIDAAARNYRMAKDSPCINAGANQAWMTGAVDLDGYRRIDRFSGRVDIGAYEFIPCGTIITITGR